MEVYNKMIYEVIKIDPILIMAILMINVLAYCYVRIKWRR